MPFLEPITTRTDPNLACANRTPSIVAPAFASCSSIPKEIACSPRRCSCTWAVTKPTWPSTGFRAMELACLLDLDAVLLDASLPDEDIYEMASDLKRLLPHSFFVAVTHHGQDRPYCPEAGVDMHLPGPVAATELIGLFDRFRHVAGGKWRIFID
jgi:CheY-like chemotaxis protein